MSQQRPESFHLASTSRLPSSPHQGETLAGSHHDLSRLTGRSSVVFPAEVWLLILESLPLRDLYSLTVVSKFFYNSFTSIYRNRVAQEGISQPNRPQDIVPFASSLFFFLIPCTSLLEATVAVIILLSQSLDSSQRYCVVSILVACCYSWILAILYYANAGTTSWFCGRSKLSWSLWFGLRIISIILVHVVLAANDCASTVRSPGHDCGKWFMILAIVWSQWALTMTPLWQIYRDSRVVTASTETHHRKLLIAAGSTRLLLG